MIYCQFTICAFIGVCCIISCCVFRTGGKTSKTRPQREYVHAKILEIPRNSSCEYCEVSNQEISDSPETEKQCDDWRDTETAAVRQYLQWRQIQSDNERYCMVPQLKHENLCRLSRDSNCNAIINDLDNDKKAPLARFEEQTENYTSFEFSHL